MARILLPMDTINIRGEELNREVIERIATCVAYELPTEEIVRRIASTRTCPARWIAFMAEAIRAGRYTP